MRKVYFLLLLILSILGWSCRKNKNETDTQSPSFDPVKPILTIPAQNAVCTTGDNQTTLQSTVTFDWDDAKNASGYTLSVKNLLTAEIKMQEVTASEAKVTLARATPYSWTVTAKSSRSNVLVPSDTWKFYNSGAGVTSYAPFPATAVYPLMGQAISATGNLITLSWDAGDVDGDLSGYDVYFGITNTPALMSSLAADVKKLEVKVNPATLYYWRVISKDAKGNKAESDIFQFKVN